MRGRPNKTKTDKNINHENRDVSYVAQPGGRERGISHGQTQDTRAHTKIASQR